MRMISSTERGLNRGRRAADTGAEIYAGCVAGGFVEQHVAIEVRQIAEGLGFRVAEAHGADSDPPLPASADAPASFKNARRVPCMMTSTLSTRIIYHASDGCRKRRRRARIGQHLDR